MSKSADNQPVKYEEDGLIYYPKQDQAMSEVLLDYEQRHGLKFDEAGFNLIFDGNTGNYEEDNVEMRLYALDGSTPGETWKVAADGQRLRLGQR